MSHGGLRFTAILRSLVILESPVVLLPRVLYTPLSNKQLAKKELQRHRKKMLAHQHVKYI
jgi:hypothetical protein